VSEAARRARLAPRARQALRPPRARHARELAFELPGGGRALFTTRAAGNLSTAAGEGHELGAARRDELCERLDLGWLCAGAQLHGDRVHVIDRVEGARGAPSAVQADARATALPGVGAMVLAADCLPVALGGRGGVAMVHAGWRGLAAGALERGVEALRELIGAEEPLAAVVGPAAGLCCYEVGPEVHAALAGGRPRRHGRRIDLRAIAQQRLQAAGVARVQHLDACTICDGRFFSHRREGERAGRHAGIAWLS